MKHPDLKIPPLAVVAAWAAAMWGASRALPALAFSLPSAAAIGVLLAVLGLGLIVAGVVTFRVHRTTLNPIRPESASSIVRTGIYSISRNPIYLGLALVLAGWAAWLSNAAAVALLPAFILYMNLFQIEREERALVERFGAEYLDYMKVTRRWL